MLTALAGGLLLALSIAAMSRLPWADWRLHLDARSWPQAQATIRSVSLSERIDAAGAAERPGTELVLAVIYDYEVEGVAHEGRAASFDDTAAAHDRRLKTLYSRLNFALVTGRPVAVFYDPAMPGRAVVDISVEGRRVAAGGGLAALGAALGLWLLLSPLRRRVRI